MHEEWPFGYQVPLPANGLLLHLPVLFETDWSFPSWHIIAIPWISFFLSISSHIPSQECKYGNVVFNILHLIFSLLTLWSPPLYNVIAFHMTPQNIHLSWVFIWWASQPIPPTQSQILGTPPICRPAWNLELATTPFLFEWSHLYLVTKSYFLLYLYKVLGICCFGARLHHPQQAWLPYFLFLPLISPTPIPFHAIPQIFFF